MVSRNTMEALAERAIQQKEALATEEAAKQALILPFISALGYDIFNPSEVIPEYTADIGTRQGEKVDYAIMRDGEPVILMECRKVTDALDNERINQLRRYFQSVTSAKIGILTNGILYKFFSNLDLDNVMDNGPFLEIDITNPGNRGFSELEHFAKQSFDVEVVRDTASKMKHLRDMKAYLAKVYVHPDEDFAELLARKVYSGLLTQTRREYFQPLVNQAFTGFINDRIASTIQRAQDIHIGNSDEDTAMSISEETSEQNDGSDDGEVTTASRGRNVETTDAEIAGYELVKSIAGEVVDPERIAMRDAQRYCAILFDDNNRKPLCRLYFNRAAKQVEIFDEERHGTRYTIGSVEDIANYSAQLQATAKNYAEE